MLWITCVYYSKDIITKTETNKISSLYLWYYKKHIDIENDIDPLEYYGNRKCRQTEFPLHWSLHGEQLGAPVVNLQLHTPIQAKLGHPPAKDIAFHCGVLTRHLLPDLRLGEHVVPHVHVCHVAHKGIWVRDAQEAILVFPQDEQAPRCDSVTGPKVLLRSHQAVDPQLRPSGVGGPGDAVVVPVVWV